MFTTQAFELHQTNTKDPTFDRKSVCPASADNLQWCFLLRTPSRFFAFDFGKSQFVEVRELFYISLKNCNKYLELPYQDEDIGEVTVE